MSRAKSTPSPASQPCACGCGELTKPGRTYIQHHHSRKSFVEYVEQDTGHRTPCWVWQKASLLGAGGNRYGQAWSERKTVSAHRLYYEQANGPIPSGLVLDHLCCTTLCVNPDHLEPVSQAENFRRGKERAAKSRKPCPCCDGRGWVPKGVS